MGAPVYVVGVGAVSAFGADWPGTFRALSAGRSAIAPVRSFDATGFPATVAAEVVGIERGADRQLAMARRAATEAFRMADPAVEPARLGVFVGAESGRVTLSTLIAFGQAAGPGPELDHERFAAAARAYVEEFSAAALSPARIAAALAAEHGARGPAQTISLACASSSAAIIEGARAIRLGVCDVALCGGVGADVDPLIFAGFSLLDALSRKGRSRPFDVARDGFVIGEGAAFVVLSRARRDAICALAGVGRSLDGHRLTAPDADGAGAARAMRQALSDAGFAAVDYVQAHGTSTPQGDAVEARALLRVLGATVERTRVSTVKGALGHWIAGAGALGVLCAVEAIARGVVLPTAGLVEPDPRCALPHVIGSALETEVERALVNSFAFGGANCSIALARAA